MTSLNPAEVFHRHAITSQSTDFLVGRTQLISEAINRIASDDVSCVLYGMRGVGKTSIAWQIISTLRNKNPKFPRNEIVKFNASDDWKVALHKCSAQIETVGDLLLELIVDSSHEYAFSKRFQKIYESEEHVSAIKRRFGINLFKTVQYSETSDSEVVSVAQSARELLSDEISKIDLFKEVMSRAAKSYPGHRVLIAFDEMDRPGTNSDDNNTKSIRGLGNFIKDMDGVQFLFVGIGQTIENIISDHQSAPRKLSGNDFEAPLLSGEEITQIFRIAERRAGGNLTISNAFSDKVVEYSGGIPWVAQHTGYEALFRKLMADSSNVVHLDIEDFEPALKGVMRIYESDTNFEAKMRELTDMGATAAEILRVLWRNPSGVSEDVLRQAIDAGFRRFFDGAIRNLESGSIISRRGKYIMFPDPVLRVFAKFYLDQT